MEAKRHSTYSIVIAAVAAAVFLVPLSTDAQIIISEIAYDLPGSDSGHEWVEVFNAGSSSITFTEWKFVEADTNHKITEVEGGATLASGAYAVIADNAATFLADNPGYSGLLFDSAFSLSNTGEVLGIRTGGGVDTDSITYNSELGAAGDGNTLHRASTSGTSFTAAAPSPGSGTLELDPSLTTPVTTPEGDDDTPPDTSFVVGKNTLYFPVEPQVYAYAGEDREVIVGADIELTGHAFAKDGTPLTDARFLWNFGDGVVMEGESVLHHWNYPGKYVLVLDIGENKYAASDEVIITAVPAQLSVAAKDGGIAVTNNAGKTIDLSLWQLYSNNSYFVIPEGTKILPKSTVVFGRDAIGTMTVVQPVALHYPNGLLAVREGEEPVQRVVASSPTITTVSVQPAKTTAPAPRTVAMAVPQAEVTEPEVAEDFQEVEEIGERDANVAAVAESGVSWGWGAALAGLIGISGAGVIALRRANRRSWNIVEETEDSQ